MDQPGERRKGNEHQEDDSEDGVLLEKDSRSMRAASPLTARQRLQPPDGIPPPVNSKRRWIRVAAVALCAAWALWRLLLLLLLLSPRAALPPHNSGVFRTRPCTVDTFAQALPSYASVERVHRVPVMGSYGEGDANLGFPRNATMLPPLCAVTVRVSNRTAAADSNYRFALFLPLGWQWNGRMLTVGSYSFAGGINWPDMGQGPPYGFATLASDGGHNSSHTALDWKPTTPDRLADWGYRAMHGSVQLGKVLIEHYYSGASVAYSYYSGCSTGGRQGLKEIQLHPESFDGALVGAPAWTTSRLMPWITRISAANLAGGNGSAALLGPAEMSLLANEALRQCDGIDGHEDSIISRPEACSLDVAALDCANQPRHAACLSKQQIQFTEEVMYADAYTAVGDFVHSGVSPGSELMWAALLSAATVDDFDTQYERYWLYNDSRWHRSQYSDQTFYDSVAANPGNATADHFDISPFRARGGKLLMYQGLADAIIPPRMTAHYYNKTRQAMNMTLDKRDDEKGLQSFFRFFQVPGMGHCFGTPPDVHAPWMFAAPGQATVLLQDHNFGAGWGVPNTLPSARHDALLALVKWVEGQRAPESIVATVWNADGTVNRTRPLCPYPEEAVFKGCGNLDSASSWRCL